MLTRDSAIVPDVRNKAFLNRAMQLQQILSEGSELPLPLKTPQDVPKNAANIIIKKDSSLASFFPRQTRKAFPRACAFAEVGWTPSGKKDFRDFKNA